MNKAKIFVGLLLLVGAAAASAWFGLQSGTKQKGPAPATLTVRYGSEKSGLLHDPEFISIMQERYGLTINGVKMGSLEMSEGGLDGVDGLWPSSELAALVFKRRHPSANGKQQNIFNTPIVFYSWPDIVDALQQEGVVQKRGKTTVADTAAFLRLMEQGRPWKEMGLPRQNGVVSVQSTDPTKSNSGFLMAGLMAVILNDGAVPDTVALQGLLGRIDAVYKRMGYMENSTGILFDKYIKQGQGAFPVIAAYESLIIEFYKAHPDYQEQIKKLVRVVLPEPTVWSEHPYIALTTAGERLLTALQDPEIQELAWQRYGFRSGVMGIDNDPAILAEIGLPERIESVTPLPSPEVMDAILQELM